MMFELLSISAEIGSIDHNDFIRKRIDSFLRGIYLKRIYSKIDKAFSNTAAQRNLIEEFIKCMGSAYCLPNRGEVCSEPIEVCGFLVKFVFTYYSYNRANIKIIWNDMYNSEDLFNIDLDQFNFMSTMHSSTMLKPSKAAYEPNELHMAALYTCMANEMKYICRSLIYKEELKHVH